MRHSRGRSRLDIGAEQDFGYFTAVTAAVNDVTNRRNNKYLSAYDQPLLFVFSSHYTTPRLHVNKLVSAVARDWELGAVLRYGSGFPIQVPTATSGLATYTFQNTFVNRVPGVPLFTQDLNCHCFDPNTTFVPNPKAWANPAPGQFGTAAAYYNDYRYQRRPQENLSLARNFRIRERMTFQLRAEFTNIFNRTYPNNPTFGNAFATQTVNAAGQTTGAGFRIDPDKHLDGNGVPAAPARSACSSVPILAPVAAGLFGRAIGFEAVPMRT